MGGNLYELTIKGVNIDICAFLESYISYKSI